MLSELTPQKEVAESESDGREKSDKASIVVLEKNVKEDRPEDEPMEQLPMQPAIYIEEEEIQIRSSPPKDQAKGPASKPLFQTPHTMQSTPRSSSRAL